VANEQRDRDKREERSDQMPAPAASAPAEQDQVVQFGGRIPASLRRRARICAAAQDMDVQDVLRAALEEYLQRRNF
jgi:hypothetical protein